MLNKLLFWKNFDKEQKVFFDLLWANWAVGFLQFLPGLLTGTLCVSAGGLHALSDGLTNVIAIISIQARKKIIALLFILGFMVFLVVGIILRALERINNPQAPEVPWFIFVILAVTFVADCFISRYEFKKGRILQSKLLLADARHTKGHYRITGAILLGAILIKIGLPPLVDPIISLVAAVFICNLIYEVCKENWPNLFHGHKR